MEKSTPFSRVDAVVLRVRNLKRARKWYRDKLGLEASFVDAMDRIAILKVGVETSISLRELKAGEKKVPSDAQGSFPVLYTVDVRGVHKHLKFFIDSLKDPGVEVGPINGEPGKIEWFEWWDIDQNKLEVRHY